MSFKKSNKPNKLKMFITAAGAVATGVFAMKGNAKTTQNPPGADSDSIPLKSEIIVSANTQTGSVSSENTYIVPADALVAVSDSLTAIDSIPPANEGVIPAGTLDVKSTTTTAAEITTTDATAPADRTVYKLSAGRRIYNLSEGFTTTADSKLDYYAGMSGWTIDVSKQKGDNIIGASIAIDPRKHGRSTDNDTSQKNFMGNYDPAVISVSDLDAFAATVKVYKKSSKNHLIKEVCVDYEQFDETNVTIASTDVRYPTGATYCDDPTKMASFSVLRITPGVGYTLNLLNQHGYMVDLDLSGGLSFGMTHENWRGRPLDVKAWLIGLNGGANFVYTHTFGKHWAVTTSLDVETNRGVGGGNGTIDNGAQGGKTGTGEIYTNLFRDRFGWNVGITYSLGK